MWHFDSSFIKSKKRIIINASLKELSTVTYPAHASACVRGRRWRNAKLARKMLQKHEEKKKLIKWALWRVIGAEVMEELKKSSIMYRLLKEDVKVIKPSNFAVLPDLETV